MTDHTLHSFVDMLLFSGYWLRPGKVLAGIEFWAVFRG